MWCFVTVWWYKAYYVLLKKFQDVTLDSRYSELIGLLLASYPGLLAPAFVACSSNISTATWRQMLG